MAHDPEIWRKVLYWLRVWSAKNAIRHQVGDGLSLIAIHEDEPSQSRPQGKPIAFLPCYHTNACTAYEIYADVRGSREAFNWFMGLAQWSGSHLSIKFVEQTPIDPRTSPDNLWLGLMFHVNWAAAVEARRQRMRKWIWRDGELAPAGGFNRRGFDRNGFHRDPLVVFYPFQDAAHTIERCRLDTDRPAYLPEELSVASAAPPERLDTASGSAPDIRYGRKFAKLEKRPEYERILTRIINAHPQRDVENPFTIDDLTALLVAELRDSEYEPGNLRSMVGTSKAWRSYYDPIKDELKRRRGRKAKQRPLQDKTLAAVAAPADAENEPLDELLDRLSRNVPGARETFKQRLPEAMQNDPTGEHRQWLDECLRNDPDGRLRELVGEILPDQWKPFANNERRSRTLC